MLGRFVVFICVLLYFTELFALSCNFPNPDEDDCTFTNLIQINNGQQHVYTGNGYTFNGQIQISGINSSLVVSGDSYNFLKSILVTDKSSMEILGKSHQFGADEDNHFIFLVNNGATANLAANTVAIWNTMNVAGAESKLTISGDQNIIHSNANGWSFHIDQGGQLEITGMDNTFNGTVALNEGAKMAVYGDFNTFIVPNGEISIDVRGGSQVEIKGTGNTFYGPMVALGEGAKVVMDGAAHIISSPSFVLAIGDGAEMEIGGRDFSFEGSVTVGGGGKLAISGNNHSFDDVLYVGNPDSTISISGSGHTFDGVISIQDNALLTIQNSQLNFQDFGNQQAMLAIEGSTLSIDRYGSIDGQIIMQGSSISGNYGQLIIREIVTSQGDSIKYIVDLAGGYIAENLEIEALDIEIGKIVEQEGDVEVIFQIYGRTLKNMNTTYNIELLDKNEYGQKVLLKINKWNELPVGSREDFTYDTIEEYTGTLISTLGTNISENLHKLHDYIMAGESVNSLKPVSWEVYFMDTHGTGSMLLDSIWELDDTNAQYGISNMNKMGVKRLGNYEVLLEPLTRQDRQDEDIIDTLETLGDRNKKEAVDGSNEVKMEWFANSLFIYTTMEDRGSVIGNEGYKGIMQLGGSLNIGEIKVSVSGLGGYGSLESSNSTNSYTIKNVTFGGLAGLSMHNEYIMGILNAGYFYSNYSTQRDVVLLSTQGEDLDINAKSNQTLSNILLGGTIGHRIDAQFVYVIPSIYYKASMVIFDEYEEEGSIADLFVEKMNSTWLMDMGGRIKVNTAVLLNSNIQVIPEASFGMGYRHYDLNGTIFKYAEYKDRDPQAILEGNNYRGLYISLGVGATLRGSSGWDLSASYLGELAKGVNNHVVGVSLQYQH